MESELFGYEKGAFTDARQDKKGLVEVADGGTLFLDEIGNLPIALQPKLLRLIEESTFRKVGGMKDIKVKIRIIAATNADIEEQIDRGSFREDLFYRLNVLPIALPPLRQRGEDVLLLADYFLHELKKELKKNQRLHPGSLAGNTAARLAGQYQGTAQYHRTGGHFLPHRLADPGGSHPRQARPARPAKRSPSASGRWNGSTSKGTQAVNNNKSKAARILGISRTTLREKLDSDQIPTT